MAYNLSYTENIYIYKHEIYSPNYHIPLITYEVFHTKFHFDINYCQSSVIEYNIPVEINENELYKYNSSNEYYHDNCTYVGNISLYDRKKEFNEKNLSLCQINCIFHSYDAFKKEVLCLCKAINSYTTINEELFFKFELLEEEKDKCLLESNIEITSTSIYENESVKNSIENSLNKSNNCYYACETCNEEGNSTHMNCLSCRKDLINNKTSKEYFFKLYQGNCIISCEDNLYLTLDEDCVSDCPNGTYKYNTNHSCLNSCPKGYELNEKQDECILNLESNNISLSEFRNIIMSTITSLANSSAVINGEDFSALIFSYGDMDLKAQLQKGISAVDLGNCTQVIKDYYNLSEDEDFIVMNIETNNNENNNSIEDNSDEAFNLNKNLQVEIYDNSGRKLELSVCKENIKVMMSLEDVEELDIESSKKFAEQGIDVFNPADNFFNDLCHKFDNVEKKDIIIDDRRTDVFQNSTFCQTGCIYTGVNYELMAADCSCNTSLFQQEGKNVTEDVEEQKETLSFKSISKTFISSLLDFNIEVIFCYNLVFDPEILSKNIGFYCMTSLLVMQIIFLVIFLIKKLRPIKSFMLNFQNPQNKNENANPPNANPPKEEKENKTIIEQNKEQEINKIKGKKNKRKSQYFNDKHDEKEPNKINIGEIVEQEVNKKHKIKKRKKSKSQHFSQSELISFKNSNITKIPQDKKEEILNINNISPENNIQPPVIDIDNTKRKKSFFKKTNLIEDDKKRRKSKGKIQELISDNKTSNEKIYEIKSKTKKRKGSKLYTRKSTNVMETIAENENDKKDKDKSSDSVNLAKTNDELQDMDYEEAIIYDKRSYMKMYWSQLIDSQIILGTFFTENNLNLLIIKISFFICIFQISFFLNALFYTDDYISDAYYNNGVLDFVSGLPKSIYSLLATLILSNLLKMLSNSKSELLKLIRESSKDKGYLKLINEKLKKLRNKLIIYFVLVFILGIFFLYYVSAFCAVYRYSQKYWFFGFLESFGMDFLFAFVTCLILSLLRFIAIRKKIKFLLVIYNILGIFL